MNDNQKAIIKFILLSPIIVPWGLAKMQWQKWFPPKVTAAQKAINAKLDLEDKAAREGQVAHNKTKQGKKR